MATETLPSNALSASSLSLVCSPTQQKFYFGALCKPHCPNTGRIPVDVITVSVEPAQQFFARKELNWTE